MKYFEEILKKIAKENGTTPEDVRLEMQRAIDEVYRQQNAAAQPVLNQMTFRGDKPTPEEFVLQLAMMLDENSELLH